MINRIERDLAGRLTEEQRSKLLEIAERCPVHRTLVFEIDIRTRVLWASHRTPCPGFSLAAPNISPE